MMETMIAIDADFLTGVSQYEGTAATAEKIKHPASEYRVTRPLSRACINTGVQRVKSLVKLAFTHNRLHS